MRVSASKKSVSDSQVGIQTQRPNPQATEHMFHRVGKRVMQSRYSEIPQSHSSKIRNS